MNKSVFMNKILEYRTILRKLYLRGSLYIIIVSHYRTIEFNRFVESSFHKNTTIVREGKLKRISQTAVIIRS